MNTELKALIDLAFGLEGVGMALVQKKDFATEVLPKLTGLILTAPTAIQNFSALKAEIDALPGTQNETDLIAYIVGKVGTDNAKAAAILQAACQLAVDGYALVKAIQS